MLLQACKRLDYRRDGTLTRDGLKSVLWARSLGLSKKHPYRPLSPHPRAVCSLSSPPLRAILSYRHRPQAALTLYRRI